MNKIAIRIFPVIDLSLVKGAEIETLMNVWHLSSEHKSLKVFPGNLFFHLFGEKSKTCVVEALMIKLYCR